MPESKNFADKGLEALAADMKTPEKLKTISNITIRDSAIYEWSNLLERFSDPEILANNLDALESLKKIFPELSEQIDALLAENAKSEK
jgi:hypothetical protein